MIRVFLDTNTLLSGLMFYGPEQEILQLARSDKKKHKSTLLELLELALVGMFISKRVKACASGAGLVFRLFCEVKGCRPEKRW